MFIGKKEIKVQDGCIITFTDNSKQVYTEKQLSYIKTENEQTESELQNTCANEIVKDLLSVLEEHNMRQGDLQYILQKLIRSYNDTFDGLVAKIFEREDVTDISTLDIQRLKRQYFNI